MRIIIEKLAPDEEESVTFRIREKTDQIKHAINLLKSATHLTVQQEGQGVLKIPITDIFYVESVDTKTFIYTETEIYRTKLKLYEAEEVLEKFDFLRINRQVVLNLAKIRSGAPGGGRRIELRLINDDKLIVSRQYAPLLKGRYGL